MENELLVLMARYESGDISDSGLVDWALEKLEEGFESKSLILLAGLAPGEYDEAQGLLRNTMIELGYELPSEEELLLQRAKDIAVKIVRKEIDPHEGADLLDDISTSLGDPDELLIFELFSHSQKGHEHLGITAESLRPSIFREAEKLTRLRIR
jgi:hypothetical protein